MNQFSIILPVKNGGEHVKECVSSILKQSYTNFNLIVLDNNSCDGTKEWIENLKDDRIIVHPSLISLTIEENWARALTVEKNEFMTLIGHDDILYSDYLVEMNELIIQHPTASLFHSHFNYINKNSEIIRACKQMPKQLKFNDFIENFFNKKMDCMGTGFTMRSKDYNIIGGIPTRYPLLLLADFELWLNLIELGYEIISPKICFAFRIHNSTTTNSKLNVHIKAFELFIDYLIEKKNNQKYLNTILHNIEAFVHIYTKGFVHSLIKTELDKRNSSENVKFVILKMKKCLNKVKPLNQYNPLSDFSIRVALWFDSNNLSRKLFLKLKPIIKLIR